MNIQLPYECGDCGDRYFEQQEADACCQTGQPPMPNEVDTSSHLIRGRLIINGPNRHEWIAGPDWVALWEVQ